MEGVDCTYSHNVHLPQTSRSSGMTVCEKLPGYTILDNRTEGLLVQSPAAAQGPRGGMES